MVTVEVRIFFRLPLRSLRWPLLPLSPSPESFSEAGQLHGGGGGGSVGRILSVFFSRVKNGAINLAKLYSEFEGIPQNHFKGCNVFIYIHIFIGKLLLVLKVSPLRNKYFFSNKCDQIDSLPVPVKLLKILNIFYIVPSYSKNINFFGGGRRLGRQVAFFGPSAPDVLGPPPPPTSPSSPVREPSFTPHL